MWTTSRTWTSSRLPVRSLRYRLMKGTVQPSAVRETTAETWFVPDAELLGYAVHDGHLVH